MWSLGCLFCRDIWFWARVRIKNLNGTFGLRGLECSHGSPNQVKGNHFMDMGSASMRDGVQHKATGKGGVLPLV